MIVIAGGARLHTPEMEDALRAGSEMAAASRDEPGCIDYRFAIDIDDPLVVRVFEQWESPDALEAHFAMPHFLAFSEVMLRAVDGPASISLGTRSRRRDRSSDDLSGARALPGAACGRSPNRPEFHAVSG